jgi:hypothetical protein
MMLVPGVTEYRLDGGAVRPLALYLRGDAALALGVDFEPVIGRRIVVTIAVVVTSSLTANSYGLFGLRWSIRPWERARLFGEVGQSCELGLQPVIACDLAGDVGQDRFGACPGTY